MKKFEDQEAKFWDLKYSLFNDIIPNEFKNIITNENNQDKDKSNDNNDNNGISLKQKEDDNLDNLNKEKGKRKK